MKGPSAVQKDEPEIKLPFEYADCKKGRKTEKKIESRILDGGYYYESFCRK